MLSQAGMYIVHLDSISCHSYSAFCVSMGFFLTEIMKAHYNDDDDHESGMGPSIISDGKSTTFSEVS